MQTARRCCVRGYSAVVFASLMQRAMNALFDSSVVGVGNGITFIFYLVVYLVGV
jgi:hypothetical protein